MTRILKWAFGIGVGLLAVGMLLGQVAPDAGGYLVVIPAAIMLGAIWFAANAMARRSRGWTRVVNPGAAHREYQAELAARKQAPEPGPKGVDDQANCPQSGVADRLVRGGQQPLSCGSLAWHSPST